jgi:hypothetical protein
MHNDDYTVAFPSVALQHRQQGKGLTRSRVTSFSRARLEGKEKELTSNMVSAGLRVRAKTLLTDLSQFCAPRVGRSLFPSNDGPRLTGAMRAR